MEEPGEPWGRKSDTVEQTFFFLLLKKIPTSWLKEKWAVSGEDVAFKGGNAPQDIQGWWEEAGDWDRLATHIKGNFSERLPAKGRLPENSGKCSVAEPALDVYCWLRPVKEDSPLPPTPLLLLPPSCQGAEGRWRRVGNDGANHAPSPSHIGW